MPLTSMLIATDDSETNGYYGVPVKPYTRLSAPDLDQRQGLPVPTGEWAPAGANPGHTPVLSHTASLCSHGPALSPQASPPDVRGHGALRSDTGDSMTYTLSPPGRRGSEEATPSGLEARAWGLQGFLKIQRNGTVACYAGAGAALQPR